MSSTRYEYVMTAAADDFLERDGLRLHWAAGTTVGKVRRLNEDAWLAVGGMFVVADGMGGHAAGDVASALTIDACREFAGDLPAQLADLEQLVSTANARVRKHAASSGSEGMGTTLVGVVLVDNGGDDGLVVVNVGDSRCYSWDDHHGLARLTHDHSVVQELIDAGTISADDAEQHPERNVVTRAIGIEPAVAADFVVLPRVEKQRLLLCSDGVSGPVPADRLASILEAADDAATAVEALIEEVMTGAAHDNATAIVIDVEWTTSALGGHAADDEEVTGPRPSPRPAVSELIDRVPIGPEKPSEMRASTAVLSEVPS